MWNKTFILILNTTIFAIFPTISAQATQVEIGVFKSSDRPEANCPQKLIITEQNSPYFEGGFTVNGEAKLSSFAGPFTIANSDPFSVTWVANLKPQFRRCIAAGRIVKYGKENYDSNSYLRVKLYGGKAYLILDMTGQRDANNFTLVITKKGVKNGNPTWSWSGTD